MKKFVIALMLLTAGFTAPELTTKAEAQIRKAKPAVKAKKRRTKRRVVKRRVRRKVARRAHFRYKHLPRYRAAVVAVPRGAVVIRQAGTVSYHYHEGVFYKPAASGFVVIRPVIGIKVATLPGVRRRIMVANQPYYYYYGTFYKEVDSEYEVVDAPEGALVDALPDGYEIKVVDGTEYYFLDGVYYQEVETDELEDGIGYEVVKL